MSEFEYWTSFEIFTLLFLLVITFGVWDIATSATRSLTILRSIEKNTEVVDRPSLDEYE